jgi:hypothetical protein
MGPGDGSWPAGSGECEISRAPWAGVTLRRMTTAIIVGIVVLAFVVGTLLTLRRDTRRGMPSQDVLDRATRRARELEAEEKAEDERRG